MSDEAFIAVTELMNLALNFRNEVRDRGDRAIELEAARISRARQAAVAGGAGLPEVHIIKACERAGIEVRWHDEMKYPQGRIGSVGVVLSPEPIRTGRRIASVPRWVAPFYEATIANSAQQDRVLRRAQDDLTYRGAGLSVWQLGGLEALVAWIEGRQP